MSPSHPEPRNAHGPTSVVLAHNMERKMTLNVHAQEYIPQSMMAPENVQVSPSDTEVSEPSQDIDPMAVIIKNIDFHLQRSDLIYIMIELGVAKPTSLNYLFENGKFHGSAFANFSTPEETINCINRLHGASICDRTITVEPKRKIVNKNRRKSKSAPNPKGKKPSPIPVVGKISEPVAENEPLYQKIHAKLLSFVENTEMDHMFFPRSYSSFQRKIVHEIAEKLGLFHTSHGPAEDRRILVARSPNFEPEILARPAMKKFTKNEEDAPLVIPIRQPYGPDPENNFSRRSKEAIAT